MSDIIAIVATKEHKENIQGSAAIFWSEDINEAQQKAMLLARIFKAMVHDIQQGIYLIVRH